MTENTVVQLAGRDAIDDPLTQLLCEGTMRLIEPAVEAELQDQLARHADRRTEVGRAGDVPLGASDALFAQDEIAWGPPCSGCI